MYTSLQSGRIFSYLHFHFSEEFSLNNILKVREGHFLKAVARVFLWLFYYEDFFETVTVLVCSLEGKSQQSTNELHISAHILSLSTLRNSSMCSILKYEKIWGVFDKIYNAQRKKRFPGNCHIYSHNLDS